ncbi:MAG: hypothetical protein E1N59_3000 [Puniceicoccaceae bacterium 5H]|nr:MAG: hypothetical protein E1N59_3000 [Puniceicoccaceae bacterium 5H]
MSTDTSPTHTQTFVNRLEELKRDRGAIAELRRYWSPTLRHYAYPHFGRLGILNRQSDMIVAAVFAQHPEHSAKGLSIGQAALKIAGGRAGAAGYEAGERHFQRLLACSDGDLEDVAHQLHRLATRLSRVEGSPLNYEKLARDLANWRFQRAEQVKLSWARDFWQAPKEEDGNQS